MGVITACFQAPSQACYYATQTGIHDTQLQPVDAFAGSCWKGETAGFVDI